MEDKKENKKSGGVVWGASRNAPLKKRIVTSTTEDSNIPQIETNYL